MDSLTQICLGAAVGEVCLGKKVGNHAILWGAVLGTVPDLDVIFKPFFGFVDGLVMHRGVSHSILFFLASSPIFGWLIHKMYKNKTSLMEWFWFSFWVMLTHAILDSFTSWGTRLFWPHPARIAWNNIFVADLLYTLPLLICLIWLMFKPKGSHMRRKLNFWGLVISSAYMLITIINKNIADHRFASELNRQKIEFTDFHSRPTPLNSILWDAVAESPDHFYTGSHSIIDNTKEIKWTSVEKKHHLMDFADDSEEWKKLKIFMNNEFIVESTESDTLLVHDLRFGKIQFPNKAPEWVFTFYVVPLPNDEINFSQKELPSEQFNWGQMSEAFGLLWRGILGDNTP